MKKLIFLSLLFVLVAGFASHGLAADPQGFTALAPIQGLTSSDATSVVNTDGFANFFNNLYRFLIGIAAVLAVIVIIWEGIQYATQDIPGVKQNAKDRIMQAIFGLILVLSPVLVFSIINPSILNLSLNLEPLDTVYVNKTEYSETSNTIGCTETSSLSSSDFIRTECINPTMAGEYSCPSRFPSGALKKIDDTRFLCSFDQTIRSYTTVRGSVLIKDYKVIPDDESVMDNYVNGCKGISGTVVTSISKALSCNDFPDNASNCVEAIMKCSPTS